MIENTDQRARQALILWGVFIGINILLNGTILFTMGKDVSVWTASALKDVLYNFIQYGLVFLVAPLILTKGWEKVRQPAFLLPLILAILAMTLRAYFRPVPVIAVLVFAWLHYRYALSELGFRSSGWLGDMVAVLLMGLIYLLPSISQIDFSSFAPASAFVAMLDRMFANPASTTEYLFYFGFLAERLSAKFGGRLTPLMIGFMYMLHEMTNPEYWYEGMNFPLVFVGVAVFAMIYLWRRSVIAIWLGDWLGRFLSRLF